MDTVCSLQGPAEPRLTNLGGTLEDCLSGILMSTEQGRDGGQQEISKGLCIM